MQRELLFRIWVPKFNSFLKSYVGDEAIGIREVGIFNSLHALPYMPQEEFIVQQFTGLLDSKGQKIFEGDIVKIDIDKCNYLVNWSSEGYFGLAKFSDYKDFPDYSFGLLSKFSKFSSVVGNIFQNPELLKS